jgi:uncharacterized protein
MRRTSTVVALATTAAVLAVPAAARAHVTINPREAAAGSFSVLSVRVPNERDRASTVKLDLRFPTGFVSVSYEPTPAGRSGCGCAGCPGRSRRRTAASPAWCRG